MNKREFNYFDHIKYNYAKLRRSGLTHEQVSKQLIEEVLAQKEQDCLQSLKWWKEHYVDDNTYALGLDALKTDEE